MADYHLQWFGCFIPGSVITQPVWSIKCLLCYGAVILTGNQTSFAAMAIESSHWTPASVPVQLNCYSIQPHWALACQMGVATDGE